MSYLKIGVVGIPGRWSTEALADAVAARTGFRLVVEMGLVTLDLQRGAILYRGMDLAGLDGLIVKTVSETNSSAVLDRLQILRFATARGVKVWSDPEALVRLIDRLASTVTLAGAGIPLPPTRVTEDPEVALDTAEEFGTALIKPLVSSHNRQREEINGASLRAVTRIAGTAANHPIMFVQKKLALPERKLNLSFLDGDFLGCYSCDASVVSSDAELPSQGIFEPHEPSPDQVELARRAQAPFGLTFATVEIAQLAGETLVLDVSPFDSFRALTECCGVDISARLADHVLSRLPG